MRAVDFQSCPKTKAKTCECSKLESITESNETIKAICQLEHSPEDVTGFVKFKQKFGEETIIKGIVKGLTPGLHGFHIHEFGDLSDGCASAGGHYNPEGVEHGGLEHGHVGDLGNIKADDQGIARFQFKAPRVQLHDVVGRAIVIHADTDDLGQGGDEESTKTGNAGDRVACGVIRLKGSIEEDYNRALSDKHFNRNELPQIRRSHIKDSDLNYKEGKISIDKIKPVQSQRVDGLSKKAEDVFLKNADRPFIVDRKGYLINGHHRYDAAHILGIKRVPAIIIDADIEDVMRTFAHTTSDAKTMAENYFNDLLQSKMEEELDEDWKNVARAGLATAALGMGVAGMDSVAPDDFTPDKAKATKSMDVKRNITKLETSSIEYQKLYKKYVEKFTDEAQDRFDRNSITKKAKLFTDVHWTKKFPSHVDFNEYLVKAYPNKEKAQQDFNIKSSMPNKVGENFVSEGVRENFAKLKQALSTESGETKEMMDIYRRAMKKQASPEEIKTANKQFKDMLKLVGLGSFIAGTSMIPASGAAIFPVEKFLNTKFGISILPNGFKDAFPPALPKSLHKVGDKVTLDGATYDVQKVDANTGTVDVKDQSGKVWTKVKSTTFFKQVSENFADGKVKGKSRPGRVKKSGASCNGSVTSLRKKAKNSSGEKSKMYHWCANMKGGKKKS